MNEKELIKKATDMDLPDYERVKTNIMLRKGKSTKLSSKNYVWVFPCTIILILSIIFPNFINQQKKTNQNGIENLENGPIDNAPIVSGNKNHIVFNALDDNTDDQSKLYFDPEKTYKRELTVDEVISYLGMDVRPSKLPHGFKEYTEVYPDTKFTIIYNNDGTVAFDQFIFSYKKDFTNEEYNPLDKQLQVLVSKQGFVKDYVILFEDEMDKSIINGHELIIGKRKIDYGPYTAVEDGPNIPTGYYDLFVAKFIMDKIHLEVIADNFTEEEFVEAITSILER
ncbi:MAG TPA: hypothetical protein VKZ77_07720 [Bacillaceae bacterium]|nr:hypothetical protein [Paenibacillus bovis]HLU22357.1 hypothetical protein [Bacillaceae bacterium]